MRIKKIFTPLILLLVLVAPWLGLSSAHAQTKGQTQGEPVVRVIMFWLGTCGNCEYVLDEALPPIQEQYGDQLEILLIELVTQEDMDRLYQTAAVYGFKKEEVGVPFMIVGERVLKGSSQIPEELPGLIELHLAGGGLDYPDHPSLAAYLPGPFDSAEVDQPGANSIEEDRQADDSAPIPAERQVPDTQPTEEAENSAANGFILAGVILVVMVAAIGYVIFVLYKGSDETGRQRSNWIDLLIPVLALAGIGVASYLTYIETQAVEAICGPVGDCNAVQSSSYARLFGVLPVGILGLAGFVMILFAWFVGKLGDDRWGSYASLAMLGMALFGTFFSIFLTYLEIWVIEAVCIWCLSSAVLISALLLLSVQPSQQAFDSILGE